MDIEMNGHKYIKDIRHCMKMLNYYHKLTSLMLIKKHHIEVGYSKMTMYEYELKYSTIIDNIDKLENKIRRLYYGNS